MVDKSAHFATCDGLSFNGYKFECIAFSINGFVPDAQLY
jgi:hypothetical protein